MKLKDKFLATYNSYLNDVYRLALSYMKNVTDAEDVTQIVFIKLYEELKKKTSGEFGKAWLFTVTANECKDQLKQHWRYWFTFKETMTSKTTSVRNIVSDELSEALLKLPVKYREVLYLYHLEGYKPSEIGKILHIKEENVRTLLRRGKEKLKVILKEEMEYAK